MPPRSADPLAATDRLLVDGSNLLHALTRDGVGAPPAALIGRLRGVVPASVGIELVFDGPPEPGMYGARVASGLIVRYGDRRSADQVLVHLVDEARAAGGTRRSVDNVLVVTDDAELRRHLLSRGARVAGTNWLIGRLERGRLAAPATGNPRAPAIANVSADKDAEAERRGWQAGRGATTKRGNPRRRRRS
ncbi:MAG TPA: NYN domain-containing protein [Candidatus Limnocylindrales bacterium]